MKILVAYKRRGGNIRSFFSVPTAATTSDGNGVAFRSSDVGEEIMATSVSSKCESVRSARCDCGRNGGINGW